MSDKYLIPVFLIAIGLMIAFLVWIVHRAGEKEAEFRAACLKADGVPYIHRYGRVCFSKGAVIDIGKGK
jgi:hypothetical protein